MAIAETEGAVKDLLGYLGITRMIRGLLLGPSSANCGKLSKNAGLYMHMYTYASLSPDKQKSQITTPEMAPLVPTWAVENSSGTRAIVKIHRIPHNNPFDSPVYNPLYYPLQRSFEYSTVYVVR